MKRINIVRNLLIAAVSAVFLILAAVCDKNEAGSGSGGLDGTVWKTDYLGGSTSNYYEVLRFDDGQVRHEGYYGETRDGYSLYDIFYEYSNSTVTLYTKSMNQRETWATGIIIDNTMLLASEYEFEDDELERRTFYKVE